MEPTQQGSISNDINAAANAMREDKVAQTGTSPLVQVNMSFSVEKSNGVVITQNSTVVPSNLTPSAQNSTEETCLILANNFLQTIDSMRTLLASDNTDLIFSKDLEMDRVEQTLEAEIEREQFVERHLQTLSEIVTQIDSKVLAPAKKQFQSTTGLLDQYPGTVAAFSGVAGLATLAAAAYLSIANEHLILHACSHLVHSILGNGTLSNVAATISAAGVIFMQGLVCLAGSLVGPCAVGIIKTAGGRINRTLSQESSRSFEEAAKEASEAHHHYVHLVHTIAKEMATIQPQLSEFYSKNEKIRLAISSYMLTTEEIDSETQSNNRHSHIHAKSSALGASELITLMSSLNLERTIRELARKDFRSPELVNAEVDLHEPQSQEFGLIRGLKLAASFFTTLATSALTIGQGSALGATKESRDNFEQLPSNVITDVVSGIGSGLSTTLQLALESGSRPDKSAYAFAKTVIGGAKSLLVGGVSEGPRLETFLKVVFELDELEKGNRVRWVSKLLPALIRAATQKPVIMEQAEKVEALSGTISPKSLSSEIAEREGRFASVKKMIGEIGKLLSATIGEATEQYLFVLPLNSIKDSPIINKLRPTLAKWADRRLAIHEEAVERDVTQKMRKDLDQLPDGNQIAQLSDSELDLYAIQKYIEFSYRADSFVSAEEMSTLLHYWTLRRKAAWHESKDTEEQHLKELTELAPHFKSLHRILHTQAGLFSRVTKALVHGEQSQEKVIQEKEEPLIQQLFSKWQAYHNQPFVTGTTTILDSTSNGLSLAVLQEDGRVSLLNAGELKKLTSEEKSAPRLSILAHADQARLTTCEMLLATKLEPYQKRALLDAHYKLLSGEIETADAVTRLEKHLFSKEQLLGTGQFKGLINLGVIGKAMDGRGNS
jgi:hypothetical protein